MYDIIKYECRTAIKEHLQNGNYTPWEYLEEISKTIGKIADHYVDKEHFDYSDNSETDGIPKVQVQEATIVLFVLVLECPHGSFYYADMQITVRNAVTELKSLDTSVRHAVLQ